MKKSYRLLLTSVAFSSVFAMAQQAATAPAAETAAPAQAQANAQVPATAPAAEVPAADSIAPAQAQATAQVPAAAPAADSAQAVETASAEAQADSSKTESVAVPAPEKPAEPKEIQLTGTQIGGPTHGMLLAEHSPYLVSSNIIVEENQALYIQSGVTLLFAPGTGIYVNNGQLVASGNSTAPVIFRSSIEPAKAGAWKGIFLTGEQPFNMRNVIITDAESGIAIEKGNLNLQVSKIQNTSSRGIYVRDGEAVIMGCEFSGNKGVALHAGNYAMVNAERTSFKDNNIALLNSELANTVVLGSEFNGNGFGVLGKENNLFYFHDTKVSGNKVGAAGLDIVDASVIASVKDNDKDFGSASIDMLGTLPSNPEIPGVESRPFNPSDKIGVLTREAEAKTKDQQKGWNIMGNAMVGGKYHYVRTRTNHHGEEIIGSDTVSYRERYKNTFQVPGFAAEAAAYLYMQSADGKSLEFNTDITADTWNHFSPNVVTLTYKDNYNTVVLGDQEKIGGEIYMAGMPLFGVDYTLALLKNNADDPLFEINGFFGEVNRSLVPGDRHPQIYKDYIEDGTAQAQRLAYGGAFKWAPVRRFDAKFGAIYASDELSDPLFRDGASEKTVTADPMVDAFTMYADGNWLFFPGDIELNGQIAVGRADTTDVIRERAINQVFTNAGLAVNSFSKLRSLMQNTSRINTLSHEELAAIFGENAALRDSEMKDSLRTLIRDAKDIQRTSEDDRDDGRVLGENWGSQNFALSASLNWNIFKTHIYGHIKYVGEDFYSAGSNDQMADYRQFDGRLEQEIFKWWVLGFNYEIDIENAASGSKTNLLGLGEGTRWGLFPDNDSKWFEENELAMDRTRYTQNIGTDQTFNINKNVTVTAGYRFQYQKQYRHYQLHGDYDLNSGIYRDDWFNARKGRATEAVVLNGDTTIVDSARWAEYNSLSDEKYLASKFQERIFKHTINAGVSVKAFNTTFKADGRWSFRIDGSKFLKDSLVEDMDLSDETWSKLGYYYGGSNYFEHMYPVSATTSFKNIQNRFSVTPRFKSYKRDDMEEAEITIGDDFEIPFMNRFLILGVNGEFRYMATDWEEDGESFDESETDILGSVNLRVNHTNHLFSEWNFGAAFYERPDDLSSEYHDIFGGVNVNYVF